MRALHDSRGSRYRDPGGAALVGGVVTLKIDVWDDPGTQATIRTWIDGEGEAFWPMELEERAEDGRLTFAGQLPCEALGILWYAFLLEGSDGVVRYYGAREGRTGGVGQMYDYMPPSFQITVYHEREVTPDWYKAGMVYQIFPDRYRRDEAWHERAAAALEKPRQGVPRALIEDWDTPVAYQRDENCRIKVWEFYGGSLEGIRQDLDRIASMGFTAIYLNPIFDAQSNHRYDTGDYLAIDPMLGTLQDFRRLANDAAQRGISLILDGVFNHTGVDSVYFNKYDNYDSVGAWQSPDSPYRPWYLMQEDGTYTCWWGVDDLPDTDKSNPQWQDFVYGPEGVVRYWLRQGARGWRLDVADELNDPFIAGIKAAETAELPDALLLGEVWEDASNKIAYGELRHYLCGDELDSAMNYPFRAALLGYLLGEMGAEEIAETMASLKENYPPEAFYACLNLLGSHDRPRLFTVLGGAPDKDSMTDEQMREYRLSEGQKGLAKGRLWLAVLVQMCSPGVPCVYYGDEAGVEGYTDPYNRSTYPWGHEDPDTQAIYHNAMALRQRFPMLVNGGFEPFSAGPDVYGFWRTPGPGDEESGECICVLVNRSLSAVHEISVPMRAPQVDDLVSGVSPVVENGEARVTLRQLGSAVLYFHGTSPLVKPLEHGQGVVAHITSLPNPDGPGTLGPEAYRFVDFLAAGRQRYWQVLPVNPCDAFGSPYAGPSAFAGNLALVHRGGHSFQELYEAWSAGAPASELFQPLTAGSAPVGEIFSAGAFEAFCAREASWLAPYATYQAIRDGVVAGEIAIDPALRRQEASAVEAQAADGEVPVAGESSSLDAVQEREASAAPKLLPLDAAPWQSWPEPYHTWSPELSRDPKLSDRVRYHEFCQWLFFVQWEALKAYANERGVSIIGDIPMYVSEDSADTWSHPEVFNLDSHGHKKECAGVPPDAFAPQGQLWGNPTYNWRALAENNYQWWLDRLGHMFRLYDYLRLDHFVGFENYYAVPRGKTALEGRWMPGPGLDLFRAAARKFGPLPVIAEDLGIITPAIRGLLSQCGFPGMDVLEFYDGDLRGGYLPAPGKIAYTSTHDTDTLLGFVRNAYGITDMNESRTLAERIMADALRSGAPVVMMPLQDVLGLGSEARMNVPGTAVGNWKWQATQEDLDSAAPLLSCLTQEAQRS